MASYVGAGTFTHVNSTSDISPPLPSGIQENDFLVCILSAQFGSPSMSSDWGVLRETWSSATRGYCWWHRYDGATPPSTTISNGGWNRAGAVIIAIRGLHTQGNCLSNFSADRSYSRWNSCPPFRRLHTNTFHLAIYHADGGGDTDIGTANGSTPTFTEQLDLFGSSTTISVNTGSMSAAGDSTATWIDGKQDRWHVAWHFALITTESESETRYWGCSPEFISEVSTGNIEPGEPDRMVDGDLMVMLVFSCPGSYDCTVDSQWTQIVSQNTVSVRVEAWYQYYDSDFEGFDSVIDRNGATAYACATILVFRDIQLGTPINVADTAIQDNNLATQVVAPSLTTDEAATCLIWSGNPSAGQTYSISAELPTYNEYMDALPQKLTFNAGGFGLFVMEQSEAGATGTRTLTGATGRHALAHIALTHRSAIAGACWYGAGVPQLGSVESSEGCIHGAV